MTLLWLADRIYRTERLPTQPNFARVRRQLPREPWLLQLIAESGVSIAWHGDPELRRDQYMVRALLLVEQGVEWDSAISQFGPAARVLHEYYSRPADAYTATIARRFVLDEARPLRAHWGLTASGIQMCVRKAAPICTPHGFSLDDASEWRGVAVGGDAGLHAGTLCDMLQDWDLPPECVNCAKMLIVVKPVVDLIALGQWHTLLLLASWKLRLWPDFPCQPPCKKRRRDDHDLEDEPPPEVHRDMVLGLMENLRRWAPAILATAGTADAKQAEQRSLEHALSRP